MTIYLGRLAQDETLTFHQETGRRMYIFSIEGKLGLDGEYQLNEGDTARVEHQNSIELQANEDTFYMMIDLP